MKRSNNTKDNTSIHFKNAATTLLAAYSNPSEFILFLSDAIYWVHALHVKKQKAVDYKESDDYIHELRVMLDLVVVPWVKNPESAQEVLAKAFEGLQSDYGWNQYRATMAQVMVALGTYEDESGHSGTEWMAKYLTGISTMYKIIDEFHAFEKEEAESREKVSQLAKAA